MVNRQSASRWRAVVASSVPTQEEFDLCCRRQTGVMQNEAAVRFKPGLPAFLVSYFDGAAPAFVAVFVQPDVRFEHDLQTQAVGEVYGCSQLVVRRVVASQLDGWAVATELKGERLERHPFGAEPFLHVAQRFLRTTWGAPVSAPVLQVRIGNSFLEDRRKTLALWFGRRWAERFLGPGGRREQGYEQGQQHGRGGTQARTCFKYGFRALFFQINPSMM
jgi:hypothetical protein